MHIHDGSQNIQAIHILSFLKKGFIIYPAALKKGAIRHERPIGSLPPPPMYFYCFLFVCFVALRAKSTAMFMAGRSVHLTTLFPGQA